MKAKTNLFVEVQHSGILLDNLVIINYEGFMKPFITEVTSGNSIYESFNHPVVTTYLNVCWHKAKNYIILDRLPIFVMMLLTFISYLQELVPVTEMGIFICFSVVLPLEIIKFSIAVRNNSLLTSSTNNWGKTITESDTEENSLSNYQIFKTTSDIVIILLIYILYYISTPTIVLTSTGVILILNLIFICLVLSERIALKLIIWSFISKKYAIFVSIIFITIFGLKKISTSGMLASNIVSSHKDTAKEFEEYECKELMMYNK